MGTLVPCYVQYIPLCCVFKSSIFTLLPEVVVISSGGYGGVELCFGEDWVGRWVWRDRLIMWYMYIQPSETRDSGAAGEDGVF